MFAALADKQDYWKERINCFVAYAPVVIPNEKSKLFRIGSKFSKILEVSASKIGIWELFGNNWTEYSKMIRVLIPGFTEAVLD